MASYNKVILMGNLTRDPELKYLPSGTAVATIGLAVSRSIYRPADPEKKRRRFVSWILKLLEDKLRLHE